jgi:hypothetical protein
MLMDLSSLPSKRDQQPLLLARSERCRSSAQWYSRQITMPHFTGTNKANTLMAVSTARLIKEYSTFSLIRWAPNPTEKKSLCSQGDGNLFLRAPLWTGSNNSFSGRKYRLGQAAGANTLRRALFLLPTWVIKQRQRRLGSC